MLKIYINSNGFKMVGKAKDVCAKLKEFQQNYENVTEVIQKNQIKKRTSPCGLKHDHNSFTIITSTHKTPIYTNYYLLFPPKK